MMAARTTTAAPFLSQCQSAIPAQTSASSTCQVSTGSCCGYGGEVRWSSEFWGSRWSGNRSIGSGKADAELSRGTSRIRTGGFANVCIKAEGFNFWQVLGGRGLKGGEVSTNTENGLKALFSDPEGSAKKKGKDDGDGRVEVSGIDGFEKELSGLVGGFPGGEKGLEKFLQEYPPPAKREKATKSTEEREKLFAAIAGPAVKAKTIVPPLLMPGMTVVVKEPRHPYYMYTGILQRVTDGRAGVLFEGGNWDKLITFKLTDLERTKQGPPMVNPKSAVLLLQPQPPDPAP